MEKGILDPKQADLDASVTPVVVDKENGKAFWCITTKLVLKDAQ